MSNQRKIITLPTLSKFTATLGYYIGYWKENIFKKVENGGNWKDNRRPEI
jgi:hypothetical protein